MGKETCSPKEARAIITAANSAMVMCARRTDEKSTEFVNNVKKMWEDRKAVETFAKYQEIMKGFIDELNSNLAIFSKAVEDIANKYAKIGGMDSMQAVELTKAAAEFDVAAIQETFDGDKFGFEDEANGKDQITQELENLVKAVDAIADETAATIRGINAFGNASINNQLGESAAKIAKILKDHISQAKGELQEAVNQVAANYTNAGQQAEAEANLGVE